MIRCSTPTQYTDLADDLARRAIAYTRIAKSRLPHAMSQVIGRSLPGGAFGVLPALSRHKCLHQLVCVRQPRERRPNVLFLLTDDQRPDTIHALGNPNIDTPNLDALARRGVAFTRAVCANPICTPSRAEILSGCSGFRNGVIDFGKQIDPDTKTLAASDDRRRLSLVVCRQVA